ncbi:MAG: lysophospholipid acyltransferase family protein [Akkermansia sp.]
MNAFYWVFYTLFKSAARAFFSHKIIHREKLIEEGPVLIIANHQSFIDPPMLGICYEDAIWFMARKSLFQSFFKWGLPICQAIPIDQENPDSKSLKTIIRLLKSGQKVLVFPEGSRSPDGQIHEAMSGIGLILAKTQVPVQPLRIHGADQVLPMGSSAMHIRPVTITIGDPINFTTQELNARGKNAYQYLANKMMDAVRALPTEE